MDKGSANNRNGTAAAIVAKTLKDMRWYEMPGSQSPPHIPKTAAITAEEVARITAAHGVFQLLSSNPSLVVFLRHFCNYLPLILLILTGTHRTHGRQVAKRPRLYLPLPDAPRVA